jgi:BMFP domain-containing protein YqiC
VVKLLEAYARTAAAELEERVAALEVRLVSA